MEIPATGISPQAQIGRVDSACREAAFFAPIRAGLDGGRVLNRRNGICFVQGTGWRKPGFRFALRAVQSEAVRPREMLESQRKPKTGDGVKLFVGLPLDAVSDCGTLNHARAIAAGLKALKLLGVEGVELPIWWGVVEREAMGQYDWAAYLALAEIVQAAGLKLHVSLCFNAAKQPKIPLPKWVLQIGESEPSIFFMDRSGHHYKGCLSLSADEVPVLNGKAPMEVYREFVESFKSSFSKFVGSTITGISVGLGPDGELRYPSHQRSSNNKLPGVGEFQCYDKNMISLLNKHAQATGNPLWGLGGPHDAPNYDESPQENNFFKDHGGSWETPYGCFFLSWYSDQLISHGNRMLSIASSTFSDTPVTIYGKLPLMHSWYKTRSHPSELTAGFYNTQARDGYDAVADMFARYSCKIIVPGMDLSEEHQLPESLSSPELLLAQIMRACRKHGVEVAGQNSSLSGVPSSFEQIKKNLMGETVINYFTYVRMGAYFFSPEHFPSFTEFVRSLNQPEMHSDDLPVEADETAQVAESLSMNSESGIQMQAA